MTYTSIIDKLIILIKLISTSWIYIAFILLISLLIVLLIMKKISKRNCFLISILLTIILFSYTIYTNYNFINKLTNNIINNLFINIYFPSAYTYLFILIVTNIVTIANLLNPSKNKDYKTINGICFIITNFTLILILDTISKQKIDIFAKESLFANPNLIALLEFGINIFITWLILLLGIYIINNITTRILNSKENIKSTAKEVLKPVTEAVKVEPIPTPVTAVELDNTPQFIPMFNINRQVQEEVMENKFIPVVEPKPVQEISKPKPVYKYEYNNSFDLSSFIPKKQEVKPINNSNVLEQIINNSLPLEEEASKSVYEEDKNTYTLNDYRIFNKMLKDIREHNQNNSITIDKNLEYRLITKYSTEAYNRFKTMLKIYSN